MSDVDAMLEEKLKETLALSQATFKQNQEDLRKRREELFNRINTHNLNNPRIGEIVQLLSQNPEIIDAAYLSVKNLAAMSTQTKEMLAKDPQAMFKVYEFLKAQYPQGNPNV